MGQSIFSIEMIKTTIFPTLKKLFNIPMIFSNYSNNIKNPSE